LNLVKLISERKFIVCVGAGGVGKTTLSAALGLLASSLGKKTLVITIDPAKRLADALGLKALPGKPKKIGAAVFEKAGISPKADLFAMMLDLKTAWDDLVVRLSDDEISVANILSNKFYSYLSHELPGSQEFVACEALYTLSIERVYDLIILDTPPTMHALDFLDAPKRILDFIDQDAFRFFIKSKSSLAGRLGLKFLDGAGFLVNSVFERFTGKTFVADFAEFLHLLSDLYPPLIKRTKGFQKLLRSNEASFLVAMSPRKASLNEAQQLYDAILDRKLPFGGFLANRVMPKIEAKGSTKEIEEFLAGNDFPSTDASRALQNQVKKILREHRAMAKSDAKILKTFSQANDDAKVIKLPLLSHDVRSSRGLGSLVPWLMQ